MLYRFNIVLYSGGDTPEDAFSNLLRDIQQTGLSLEDEIEFEKVELPLHIENTLSS